MRTPVRRIPEGNPHFLDVGLAHAIGKVLRDVSGIFRTWHWSQWGLAICVITGLFLAVWFMVHPPEVMGSSASGTHRCGCL